MLIRAIELDLGDLSDLGSRKNWRYPLNIMGKTRRKLQDYFRWGRREYWLLLDLLCSSHRIYLIDPKHLSQPSESGVVGLDYPKIDYNSLAFGIRITQRLWPPRLDVHPPKIIRVEKSNWVRRSLGLLDKY